MKLFDEVDRQDERWQGHGEADFAFLNTSAKPIITAVRDTLETWYSDYGSDDDGDLRKRFRSKINKQHAAAFFELYLHEFCLQRGCVIQAHPLLAGVSTHPDFLVTPADGQRFYLEARLVSGQSDAEVGLDANVSRVYDAIDQKLGPSDFFVLVSVDEVGEGSPPTKRIVGGLRSFLSGLNPDDYDSSRYCRLPRYECSEAGWEIAFLAVPKKPEARAKAGIRPIRATNQGDAQWIDSAGHLRDALSQKAGRYGTAMQDPFVIALNATLQSPDTDDVLCALFGEAEYKVEYGGGKLRNAGMARRPDGIWGSSTQPRNKQVSGVLLATELLPHTVASRTPCLWLNPWATHPLPQGFLGLETVVLEDGRFKVIPGGSGAELFGLPEGWPDCEQ